MLSIDFRPVGRLPKSVPLPSHRHATPSGPWPWMDLESEETDHPQQTRTCAHENCNICSEWLGYPQSHFPNWTPDQVLRCRITPRITDRQHDCRIYHVDVTNDQGKFAPCDREGFHVTRTNERELWDWLKTSSRPSGLRVRALFVEDLSGPVLQILGGCYTIEPFFFSSSLNWIPSRYQENVLPKEGDHITITLTFLRTMPTPPVLPPSISSQASTRTVHYVEGDAVEDSTEDLPLADLTSDVKKQPKTEVIDTQAPLVLRADGDEKVLLLDVLDLHMIRDLETSTIVSYHADPEWRMTPASGLHSRVRLIGESVYWQHIFRKSTDPTFLLLAILWHAMYAWDEALECLYSHICFLEEKVLKTNNMMITRELHIIRAHLLHYASLLEDFRKSVQFVLDTPNPAMNSDTLVNGEKQNDRKLLEQEGLNLLSEIKRLELSRMMQDKRLKNVMNLVFSSVNLEDSKRMQRMTEAAVRDSEAMKQISYLTMVFLPATFVAGVFGMNVGEINPGTRGTFPHYVLTVIPLTLVTIWIIVAFQSKYYAAGQRPTMWSRFLWPFLLGKRLFSNAVNSSQATSVTVTV